MVSEMMQESTGFATHNIKEEKPEESPQLVKLTEVSELKVILTPKLDHQEEPTTREETWLESKTIDHK